MSDALTDLATEEDSESFQPDHAMLFEQIEELRQTLNLQLRVLSEELTHTQGLLLGIRAQLEKLTPLAEVFENFGKVMEGGGGGLLMSKMLGG